MGQHGASGCVFGKAKSRDGDDAFPTEKNSKRWFTINGHFDAASIEGVDLICIHKLITIIIPVICLSGAPPLRA